MLHQACMLSINSAIVDSANTANEGIASIYSQLSTVAIGQAQHATIVTETQANILELKQDTQGIRSLVARLLDLYDTRSLASLLRTQLEQIIADQIKKILESDHKELSYASQAGLRQPEPHPESVDTEPVTEVGESSSQSSSVPSATSSELKQSFSCEEHEAAEDLATVRPKKLRRRHVVVKSYNLWFARVIVSTRRQCVGGKLDRIVTDIVIFPNPCLLQRGVVLIFDRILSTSAKPPLQFSLRPFSIIPSDNPVLEAIRKSDIHLVREFFNGGVASPYDLTEDGKNLLHLTYESIVIIKSEPLVPYEGPHRQSVKNLLDLSTWLIAMGVDPAAKSHNNEYVSFYCLLWNF